MMTRASRMPCMLAMTRASSFCLAMRKICWCWALVIVHDCLSRTVSNMSEVTMRPDDTDPPGCPDWVKLNIIEQTLR